jgi:hypothetical protein
MTVEIECPYCGHKKFQNASKWRAQAGRPYICGHGNCTHSKVIIRDLSKNVDYYKGCPPFPAESDDTWASVLAGIDYGTEIRD